MPSKTRLSRYKQNYDFEIQFFESILKEDPDFIEVLQALAENYTQAGHYEKGLLMDLKLASLLPEDPITHYNLACSFSLLSRISESFEALKKALLRGYHDFDYMEKDSDLAHLRAHPCYEKIKKALFLMG